MSKNPFSGQPIRWSAIGSRRFANVVNYGEDVTAWVGAIDWALVEQGQEQTLLGLQEQLRMPWVWVCG
jgi:hypothetical protein